MQFDYLPYLVVPWLVGGVIAVVVAVWLALS